MLNKGMSRGKRRSLLGDYGSQLGRLVERSAAEAALVAAKQDAEQSAQTARSALIHLTRAKQAVTQSEEQLRATLENMVDGVIVVTADGTIETVNPAAERMFGYEAPELVGGSLIDLLRLPDDNKDPDEICKLFQEVDDRPTARGVEVTGSHKSGGIVPLEISVGKITAGEPCYYICTFRDISDRKEAQALIMRQANYDSLTQLPNRNLFLDRMSSALSRAHRGNHKFGLLFIDLDGFKKVNDTLGHAAGDKLLQEASERLTSCVREIDTVARVGGDEFTIILSDLHSPHDVDPVVREVLQCLSSPYMLDGMEVFTSGSVGITIYPDDGYDAETLLKNADAAMYRAKDDGRNRFRFFTAEMNAEALENVKLEGLLRHAIERDEFVLHYQPIIDLRSGMVTGAEALLRWQHPERGLVSPNTFVPLAEETGLIVPIGEWVFRTACAQMKDWSDKGLSSLSMSVNLSPRQCREAGVSRTMQNVLAETGVDPASMTLEITENLLMEDRGGDAAGTLHRLKEQGLSLSLDDFGTGYSSLSYLKRFPFDILKIDRAFVTDVATDAEDKALIEAMIAMAHGLNIKVVGEGAESMEQVDFLRSRSCDKVQGYYFSKPVPAAEFEELVSGQRESATNVVTFGHVTLEQAHERRFAVA